MFCSSIKLIAKCHNMKQLKQIHAQIISLGLGGDTYALSRLMAFCANPTRGSLSHACMLFERIEFPSLCVHNTMIKAFLLNGELVKAVGVFTKILKDCWYPDNYTFPYVLKACARLGELDLGGQIHGQVVKLGYGGDVYVGNTLMLMYSELGDLEGARKMFDEMPECTEVAWTIMIIGYCKKGDVDSAILAFDKAPVKDRGIWGAMISGYVQNNCFKEGLKLFQLMQLEGVEPDEGILVSALCACAQMGALDTGIWIHGYVKRVRFMLSVRLGTALIDMYIKCGSLGDAKEIFYEMSQKDVICWNVMILGLALHGDGEGSFELFWQMQRDGFSADDVTFIAIFTACSHSSMVEKGLHEFNNMKTVYGIEPRPEHYGCIVDLLGRAGRFEEAMKFVQSLPPSCSPSEEAVVWRALLSACFNQRETHFAEVAANRLVQLERHSGVYTLLSNICAAEGKYDDAKKLKMLMKDRGVEKIPGCSSIEVGGFVHEFIASEKTHPQMDEVRELLGHANKQMDLTISEMNASWQAIS